MKVLGSTEWRAFSSVCREVVHLRRRQLLDDFTDWAKLDLPRVVHLSVDRREFRSFVQVRS